MQTEFVAGRDEEARTAYRFDPPSAAVCRDLRSEGD